MTIWIAADHAGYELKQKLMAALPGLPWQDLGTHSEASVHYPVFASRVAAALAEKPAEDRGVLICGTGQGMAMRANRYPHIRAALACGPEIVRLAREHNDANVLCFAGRSQTSEVAQELLQLFLATPFAGGRHSTRVEMLSEPISEVITGEKSK